MQNNEKSSRGGSKASAIIIAATITAALWAWALLTGMISLAEMSSK